jgi:putative DNA primase/helicase
VISIDNLSGLSAEMADNFCRLATGSEIGGRALFTNFETASFSASRPVVLNGIPELAARTDLVDRSLFLRLPAIGERTTERDGQVAANAALSAAFGAFLDAMVLAMRRLETVPTPNIRMADFARLVAAAEPALPWRPGTFLDVYQRNRKHGAAAVVEDDVVAWAVRMFMEERSRWGGLTSQLYLLLDERIPLDAKRSGKWPGSPRWFSDRLRRAATALRQTGIHIIEGARTAAGVPIAIERVDAPAAQPTDVSVVV